MRLFRFLFSLTVLLGCTLPSSAQFSISKVNPNETATKTMDDTIKPIAPLNNLFYSEARYKAERRAIRKERNTLQMTVSAMGTYTGFSKNWAAGGNNVFAFNAATSFSHTFTKNKFMLQNTFDARYGMNVISQSDSTSTTFKNEDNFVYNLSASWNFSKNWSYAATFQFRSQFAKGYKSATQRAIVSAFMAPGTISPALGLIYRNQKVPLTIQIMPVAGSITFITNDSIADKGLYGDPGQHQVKAVGSSLQIDFDKKFAGDRMSYKTYFYIFSNYDKNSYANWKNTLNFKLYKLFTLQLYCSLVYDEKTRIPGNRNWLQVNYSTGLGISYTFKNK